MRRGWGLVIVAAAGCGRTGFDTAVDSSRSGSGDGGSGDAGSVSIDAPNIDLVDAPAGTVVATFGETPGATYSGVTTDTYLLNDGGSTTTYNYGASPTLTMESSQKRALVRFDMSAIPAGKTLAAARLHVNINYAETGSCTIALAPVLEAWTEGTMSGAAGVANWTQRSSSQSWTTAGAGTPGSSGSQLATGTGASGELIGIDLPTATVQGWIDTPAGNYGLAITTSGSSECRVDSRESATPAARPEMVITYYP